MNGSEPQFLAAIIESSDDAIISKSLEGRILSWNSAAERLFGYTAGEAIGSSITIIIPPERLDEESTILSRLRRGERIDHFQTVRLTKFGRRVDISLTISPIRDVTGRIVAASKIARDITATKQSEAALLVLNRKLSESDRRKDEFLATLAHELRNPLAPLANALECLKLSDELSPTAASLRETMELQVNQLIRLVDDLVQVSRITRGTVELRKTPIELAAVVATAVATSRPLIEAAGLQLALDVSAEPMTLMADQMRLAQVVANLLNNAAKYTEPGGRIWLTARPDEEEAIVSVRDNGVGIPAEVISRVFDLFVQLDRTQHRAQGGLGIGLSLAKNLVEMHGGRIEARSGGPGKGSEFRVRLPLAPAGVTATVAAPGQPIARSPLPARRILVVDDARAAAYVLGQLLEQMGQEVFIVRDAATALQLARAERPDVVISDIEMPNMTGYELATRMRQEPKLERVVLVALTGYGQDRDRQRALAAGFDHHLVKPAGVAALHELLASLPATASVVRPPVPAVAAQS